MKTTGWTLIATFTWLQEALLLKSRLEGAGIPAHIPEEHIASISPMTTVMQVRVLVPSSEFERAREILDLPEDEKEDDIACAACGGTAFQRKGSGLKNFFAVIAALISSAPMRKFEDTVCSKCRSLRK